MPFFGADVAAVDDTVEEGARGANGAFCFEADVLSAVRGGRGEKTLQTHLEEAQR